LFAKTLLQFHLSCEVYKEIPVVRAIIKEEETVPTALQFIKKALINSTWNNSKKLFHPLSLRKSLKAVFTLP